MRPRFAILAVFAILAALITPTTLGALAGCSSAAPAGGQPITSTSAATTQSGDAVIAEAFADRASGLQVEGRGVVQRLLADDTSGERHQRFVVQLASGQTLLIAHNIDVAPRVAGLQVGEEVSFSGEYEWNPQGGLVHWTHRDPSGTHPAGWIDYRGTRYQ